MACSHTDTCPLFPLISLNSALRVWQVFYCEGEHSKCSRYKKAVAGQAVPANLLPNGKLLEVNNSGKGINVEAPASDTPTSDTPTSDTLEKIVAVARQDAAATAGHMTGKTGTRPGNEAADKVESGAKSGSEKETEKGGEDASVSSGVTSADGHDTVSYYLRFKAVDVSGVMANVIQALGKQRISVDAMAQKHLASASNQALFFVLTGQTAKAALDHAIADIEQISELDGAVVSLPLEHIPADMFG